MRARTLGWVPGVHEAGSCTPAQGSAGATTRAPRRERASRLRSAELDSEQGRLLALLAEGSRLAEAAASLELSQRTAERRLAAARSLLGARTTAQAVARATSTSQAAPRHPSKELSPRERQVLEGVAGGLTSREIAERLAMPASTVDALVRSAISKFAARTRIQAAALALTDPAGKLAEFIDESPSSSA
jgi:DNA-binding NarL/FixJ family response regulator